MPTPKLGVIDLSGTRTVVLKRGSYLPEHLIPGREGGIVEDLGQPMDRIEIHGFFFTSGDELKYILSGMPGTVQHFEAPSFEAGQYFAFGSVLIEKYTVNQVAGRAYPYYEYSIYATFSGENFAVSPYTAIDYNYELPINMMVETVTWNYELPINMIVEDTNWNYELPINMQAMGGNWVQIS